MLDCNEFVDGIDTESVSYKLHNSLNQLRYDYQKQISFQRDIMQQGPFKEVKFLAYYDRY